MARLKQKYGAFKTAERLYKRRRTALREEYSKLLVEAAKKGDWDNFDALFEDAEIDLGIYAPKLCVTMCETRYNRKEDERIFKSN